MLATFIVETVFVLYTIVRYRLNTTGRLVVTMLLALAAFQLCEYHVCGGWGVRASDWSRAGYVAITLLPVLGVHLVHVLAGKPQRKLVAFAYATMAGFITCFTLLPHIFQGYTCTGNYVIFQIDLRPAWAYGAYYYGWILAGVVLAARWARQLKRAGSKAKFKLLTLRALVLGYLVFLVPTAVANSVKPETRQGIPSIMCGFAVLYAIILTLYILPKVGARRTHQK